MRVVCAQCGLEFETIAQGCVLGKYCSASCVRLNRNFKDRERRRQQGHSRQALKCECGDCKTCRARKRGRKWRQSKGYQASRERYVVRSGRKRSEFSRAIAEVLLEIKHALCQERRDSDKELALLQLQAVKREKGRKRWIQSFRCLIFQPAVCTDCGQFFETLYPTEHPFYSVGKGTVRCRTCRKNKWNSNHGGDFRRCQKFGVPYDGGINRIAVLEKDNWTCYRCGRPTPKEKRGTYEFDAPEVDHVWALAEIRNGEKSPGHVYSNLRCICRQCNTEKNSEIQNKHNNESFHQKRRNGWLNRNKANVPTEVVCPVCGKIETRQRVNARYCSDICARVGRNRRRSRFNLPYSFVCCDCYDSFEGKRFNQTRCKRCWQRKHTQKNLRRAEYEAATQLFRPNGHKIHLSQFLKTVAWG